MKYKEIEFINQIIIDFFYYNILHSLKQCFRVFRKLQPPADPYPGYTLLGSAEILFIRLDLLVKSHLSICCKFFINFGS